MQGKTSIWMVGGSWSHVILTQDMSQGHSVYLNVGCVHMSTFIYPTLIVLAVQIKMQLFLQQWMIQGARTNILVPSSNEKHFKAFNLHDNLHHILQ